MDERKRFVNNSSSFIARGSLFCTYNNNQLKDQARCPGHTSQPPGLCVYESELAVFV